MKKVLIMHVRHNKLLVAIATFLVLFLLWVNQSSVMVFGGVDSLNWREVLSLVFNSYCTWD